MFLLMRALHDLLNDIITWLHKDTQMEYSSLCAKATIVSPGTIWIHLMDCLGRQGLFGHSIEVESENTLCPSLSYICVLISM